MPEKIGVRKLLLLDACVLIDFIKADPSVLTMIVENLGQVYVASPIVSEVHDVEGEAGLVALGLEVLEPELEELFRAQEMVGTTSFEDNICLLLAKRFGFICVTNDVNLRKYCVKESVSVLWGLDLLAELVASTALLPSEAYQIAYKIHTTNPKHITPRILNRFKEKVGA